MDDRITLAHGSGGLASQELIEEVFFSAFDNPQLDEADDAARFLTDQGQWCMSTDSFVVQPQDFPGGDIGKLSICGTVNDLAVAGATSSLISVGLILEEGLSMSDLTRYIKSMAKTAKEAGVQIVTGDTKVVAANQCDKIYINTSGVGPIKPHHYPYNQQIPVEPDHAFIINGYVGDHGMAIFSSRYPDQVNTPIVSDCACLNDLIHTVLEAKIQISFMRDPTRGGVAGVLNEIARSSRLGLKSKPAKYLSEMKLPVCANWWALIRSTWQMKASVFYFVRKTTPIKFCKSCTNTHLGNKPN